MPVNPKVNDKWYNISRFMGEKTQENSVMGYSAAYPTGRELIVKEFNFDGCLYSDFLQVIL
jgi:hypothetical protein